MAKGIFQVFIRETPSEVTYERKLATVYQVILLILELICFACFAYLVPFVTLMMTSGKDHAWFVLFMVWGVVIGSLAAACVLDFFRSNEKVSVNPVSGDLSCFRGGLLRALTMKKTNIKRIREAHSRFIPMYGEGATDARVEMTLKLSDGKTMLLPEVSVQKEADWFFALLKRYFSEINITKS